MPIFVASGTKIRVFRPANKAGDDVRLIERRAMAMEMRREGSNYRQIAVALGVSPTTAYSYVQAELSDMRESTAEDVEAQRDIELQRCDEMLRALKPDIRAGDPTAVMAALKVSERRSKLLGLDAPERKTVLHATVTPEEAAKMSEEELFARAKHVFSVVGASLRPDNPLLAGIPADDTLLDLSDPDNSDAALEAEDARLPAKVSIDVRQFVSPARQGPNAIPRMVAPAAEFESDPE